METILVGTGAPSPIVKRVTDHGHRPMVRLTQQHFCLQIPLVARRCKLRVAR